MLHINSERLLADLASLAQIGATSDDGVERLAMSEADVAGRRWFEQRVKEAGLAFHADGAGNISAVLRSSNPNAKTLMAGSHLDTVPNGGRYDGALGVLSALEALRSIREAGLDLPVHLEAISFTDEEGSLLYLFGSRSLIGELEPECLNNSRGGEHGVRDGMRRLGLTVESMLQAKRDKQTIAGYVELHIEQGARLEEAGTNIGIVTSIVGISDFWLTYTGKANHAGTTPMDRRADAMWGASAFVQRASQLVKQEFHPGVMNVGEISAKPGAFNIVPAEVKLSFEFRHGTLETLADMELKLLSLADSIAAEYGLGLKIEPAGGYPPALMDERVLSAFETSADELNLTHTRLLSFAGHDAESMAHIVPSGMIFVPSVGGISHSPKEFTHPQDIVNGANVLLNTIVRLGSSLT
jgi:N-carbamoyl-L-amino-acid hydrolase